MNIPLDEELRVLFVAAAERAAAYYAALPVPDPWLTIPEAVAYSNLSEKHVRWLVLSRPYRAAAAGKAERPAIEAKILRDETGFAKGRRGRTWTLTSLAMPTASRLNAVLLLTPSLFMKIVATVTLELAGQTFQLFMSEPAQRAYLASVYGQREAAWAAEVEADRLARTYHLGEKPTSGRGYDDRLKMRLGCGSDMAREMVTSRRIAHQYLGNRYSVCEQAVRDFYATKSKQSA